MLTIKECCDRFGIASKKTLYSRINALAAAGVDVSLAQHNGKSFIFEALQRELDSQHEHLKQGGKLSDYQPVSPVTVLAQEDTTRHDLTTQHDDTTQPEIKISSDSIQQIAIALAQVLKPILPEPNPIINHRRLAEAAEFKYQLTSKELKSLGVFVKYSDRFTQGAYQFVKVGKIGHCIAWMVVPNMEGRSQLG